MRDQPEDSDNTESSSRSGEMFEGPGMRRKNKIVNVIALTALLGGSVSFLWVMSSLPRIEGKVQVSGLQTSATIARDGDGVPWISAHSARDAYFALGWTHAQDRMWQMEIQRRIGAGRLSEVVGERGIANDRFLRTLGLRHLAEAGFPKLDASTREALTSYAEGVNTWLRDNRLRLPPEFYLFGITPDPWKPADSLVWGRLMALQLTGNWRDELLKAKLSGSLDPRHLGELWPRYPSDAPTTLAAAQAGALLAEIPEAAEPRLASNVWAVSGNRTASGKPLLANDPHLAFQAPVLWYLAGVEAPGLSVAGATVPGVPFHMVGHNDRIAWGTTTTHADTVDLVVEKLWGDDSYMTQQGPVKLGVRKEVIKVRGASDQILTVRETRDGPIVSDLIAADQVESGQAIAFKSTALVPEDLTAQAMYKLNRASDWRGFTAALKEFNSPVQNFAYADVSGAIGFVTAGRVPLRRSGDGSVPVRGWTGEGDWTGWVPPEKLPQQLNPKSGRVINANNRVTGDAYPYNISAAWPEGYRAQRIQNMLDGRKGLTMDDMAEMQRDSLSLAAVELKELLGVPDSQSSRAVEAAKMIAAWDGRADKDRPEPLIMAEWLRQLWRGVFADELGADFAQFRTIRPYVLAGVLTQNRHWCDDISTPEAESCEQQVARALERAVNELTARHGASMAAWKWGDEHQARMEHPFLHHVPLLSRMADMSVATDGDDFTVNRGSFGPEGFSHVHGAGLRAIYDLSDLWKSRFVIATGQSGNPLSRRYGDLLQAWSSNRGITINPQNTSPQALLTLEPTR